MAPAFQEKLHQKQDRFRIWKHLARFVVFAVVVALAVTHFSGADLAHAFTRMKARDLVIVVFVLSPLGLLLRSLRWRCLLPGGERVPLVSYMGAGLIGVLANTLLGKFGDLIKARMICGNDLNYGQSLAVVVIDRLLEAAALLLIFAAVLCAAPLPAWVHRLAWLAGIGTLGALAALRLLARRKERCLMLAGLATRRFTAAGRDRLVGMVERLLAGCHAMGDLRRVLAGIVYGSAAWSVEIATVTIFLKAFAVPAPWLIAASVILVALGFGTLVPISPGAVGVYQWLCAFSLSIWGVDRQLGLTLGVVMQTVLLLPPCLAGAVWLLALRRQTGTPASSVP